jgi:hypothetical protein
MEAAILMKRDDMLGLEVIMEGDRKDLDKKE